VNNSPNPTKKTQDTKPYNHNAAIAASLSKTMAGSTQQSKSSSSKKRSKKSYQSIKITTTQTPNNKKKSEITVKLNADSTTNIIMGDKHETYVNLMERVSLPDLADIQSLIESVEKLSSKGQSRSEKKSKSVKEKNEEATATETDSSKTNKAPLVYASKVTVNEEPVSGVTVDGLFKVGGGKGRRRGRLVNMGSLNVSGGSVEVYGTETQIIYRK